MNTLKFQTLIQKITNRDFVIKTKDEFLINEKEYCISRTLPISGIEIKFYWKVAKTDEKILKSFITTYCNKYKEPNPNRFNGRYSRDWQKMTDSDREFAYICHSDFMYSKKELMEQIENSFNSPEIEQTLLKYGFYPTEYGIGIFSLFASDYVLNAIFKMKQYLKSQNIPFSNEFSDAKWVYRFKLNLEKNTHTQILKSFTI